MVPILFVFKQEGQDIDVQHLDEIVDGHRPDSDEEQEGGRNSFGDVGNEVFYKQKYKNPLYEAVEGDGERVEDRKSTRLNSSHDQ